MKAAILSPRSKSSKLYLLALALLMLLVHPLAASAQQATFYVSPTGSDSNPGTLTAPLQTITAAQTAVRALTSNMIGNIVVYLRAGVYQLSAPLTFGVQDSGTNGFNVIYQAYNNEVPVISGGIPVTGWTQVSGNIYSAPFSRSTKLRSLFVNGVRATMTKSGAVQGYGNEGAFTIPSSENPVCFWPLWVRSERRHPQLSRQVNDSSLQQTEQKRTANSKDPRKHGDFDVCLLASQA